MGRIRDSYLKFKESRENEREKRALARARINPTVEDRIRYLQKARDYLVRGPVTVSVVGKKDKIRMQRSQDLYDYLLIALKKPEEEITLELEEIFFQAGCMVQEFGCLLEKAGVDDTANCDYDYEKNLEEHRTIRDWIENDLF